MSAVKSYWAANSVATRALSEALELASAVLMMSATDWLTLDKAVVTADTLTNAASLSMFSNTD